MGDSMWTLLTYTLAFLAGFGVGGIVVYVRTSRFYLRMHRAKYD